MYITQLTPYSTNSLRFTAQMSKPAHTEKKLKQAPKPTKSAKRATTRPRNDAEHHDKVGIDDRACNDSSHNLYYGSATGEEEVEARKTSNVVPYQLQQWMAETSNHCITLAERLEKSKWTCEDAGTEECLIVDESDESWGRKPYDWILFDE